MKIDINNLVPEEKDARAITSIRDRLVTALNVVLDQCRSEPNEYVSTAMISMAGMILNDALGNPDEDVKTSVAALFAASLDGDKAVTLVTRMLAMVVEAPKDSN